MRIKEAFKEGLKAGAAAFRREVLQPPVKKMTIDEALALAGKLGLSVTPLKDGSYEFRLGDKVI